MMEIEIEFSIETLQDGSHTVGPTGRRFTPTWAYFLARDFDAGEIAMAVNYLTALTELGRARIVVTAT